MGIYIQFVDGKKTGSNCLKARTTKQSISKSRKITVPFLCCLVVIFCLFALCFVLLYVLFVGGFYCIILLCFSVLHLEYCFYSSSFRLL